jgi:hypothetical protein
MKHGDATPGTPTPKGDPRMERNRFVKELQAGINREPSIEGAITEADVRTLTDLELVLAGGGEDVVVWNPPR